MARALLLAAVVLAGTAAPIHANDSEGVRAIIVERALAHGANATALVTTIGCESEFDPRAVGDGGASLGLAQLNRKGLLPAFFRMGYTDVWSAHQQADFAAIAFSTGKAEQWSCYHTEVLQKCPPWWSLLACSEFGRRRGWW